IDVELPVSSSISREDTELPTTRGRKSIMNKFLSTTYFAKVLQSSKDVMWQCVRKI
ncbi:hypothetical protein MKW94_025526, partial [Papaver nudicaule]|nr:hypothetical protein [Papaver nudicaule]